MDSFCSLLTALMLSPLAGAGARAAVTAGDVHPPIDRHALVTRHNVTLDKPDSQCALQVGNGNFAFGVDVTGLQTFYGNTLSQWAWHSSALPPGERPENYRWPEWDHAGRKVPYLTESSTQKALENWMFTNPTRLGLGRLGLRLARDDGKAARLEDLTDIHQELDLWSGLITSQFTFQGQPVHVETICDPTRDAVAVNVESPLIAAGRLSIALDFPYADTRYFADLVGDWGRPDAHQTVMTPHGPNRADFDRTVDASHYHVSLGWSSGAALHGPPIEAPPGVLKIVKAVYGARDQWVDVTALVAAAVHGNRLSILAGNDLAGDPIKDTPKTLNVTYSREGDERTARIPEGQELRIPASSDRHRYLLTSGGANLECTCAFSPRSDARGLPGFTAVKQASADYWSQFWRSGGAIDLSGSKDPRAAELERRLVLSQYLMAVNEAGSLPPQESGLVNNGWFGKFHLEMYWWHAAHYALWDRWPLWDRSIGYLTSILPQARAIAKKQGYKGARWPKMVGPEGRDSPNGINPLLIWQESHPIFYAELDYRAHPTRKTLAKWRVIVFETAAFMADFPVWNVAKQRYDLAPPIKTVPENTGPATVLNPAFELSYWRFGLRTAQLWRERLGLPRDPQWDKMLQRLAPLPQQDGVYVMEESQPDTYEKHNWEHPSLVGAFGMLPGDGVDRETMHRTMKKVAQVWNWNRTWGWDFPMLAMCAAKVGEPEIAVNMLLHPSGGFQFNKYGLATGGPFPYFPANGGLLYAVALMAAGWDGAPSRNAPGFPDNGQWNVRWEGLKPAP